MSRGCAAGTQSSVKSKAIGDVGTVNNTNQKYSACMYKMCTKAQKSKFVTCSNFICLHEVTVWLVYNRKSEESVREWIEKVTKIILN